MQHEDVIRYRIWDTIHGHRLQSSKKVYPILNTYLYLKNEANHNAIEIYMEQTNLNIRFM